MKAQARGRGFTLIDLIVIITLLGVVAGGMTVVFARLAERSAAGQHERAAQLLAQSLLAEVRAMPFTYCDANDTNAATATRGVLGGTAARCASQVDTLGPEPGESRYGPSRYDSVNDYHNFTMPGPGCAALCNRNGQPLNASGLLATCQARVTTTPAALPGIPALDADGNAQALRVRVTLACPGQADTVVEGIRTRHSPNGF